MAQVLGVGHRAVRYLATPGGGATAPARHATATPTVPSLPPGTDLLVVDSSAGQTGDFTRSVTLQQRAVNPARGEGLSRRMDIGITRQLGCGYDEALERVTEALQAEGFGVLTRVDMKETLKAKLGVDFRRFTILGACNPPIAYRALSAHLGFGVLMPCNVTVYEGDDGRAVVRAVDPTQTVAPQVSPEVAALATEVRERLQRAVERA